MIRKQRGGGQHTVVKLRASLATVATVAGAASLAVSIADPADAYQIFTNRTQWESAVSGLTITTEDFSASTGEVLPSLIPTLFPSGLAVVPGSGYVSSVQGATSELVFRPFFAPANERSGEEATFFFPSGVVGFGLDVLNAPFQGARLAYLEAIAPDFQVNPLADPLDPGFYGIVASSLEGFFDGLLIRCLFGSCSDIEPIIVDNISFARQPEPEPTTIPEPTVGLGSLLGLSWLLRKKRDSLN